VVIAIIAILASMLLPVLSRAKEAAYRIKCVNNLKELELSLKLYADDNGGLCPPRTNARRWPTLLQGGYRSLSLLICPTDARRSGAPATDTSSPTPADRAPRSYFINGWNDYFSHIMSADDLQNIYLAGTYPGASIKENIILKPTDTLIFGEKKHEAGDYFMDSLEGTAGNEFSQAEHGRHSGANPMVRGRGSNYAFADGGVRFLKYGTSIWPLDLWAISDKDRIDFAFEPP
jgi:prepilin-type processing-associated H-X9-DG protein